MAGILAQQQTADVGYAASLARDAARPGAGKAMGGMQQATDAEQAEYEDASQIVAKSLYEGEASQAVMGLLQGTENKLERVMKASSMALKLLDERYDFDEVLIAELTRDITARVIEMDEALNGEEFTPQEEKGALATTWEAVINIYGVDTDEYAELTDGMQDKDLKNMQGQYDALQKEVFGSGQAR